MDDITVRLRRGFGGLVPPVCDEAANEIDRLRLKDEKLNAIAATLDYWLKSQKLQRDKESIATNDGTHVITPPSWPTRGTLKEWIKVLRG